jgi:hypothetical protein
LESNLMSWKAARLVACVLVAATITVGPAAAQLSSPLPGASFPAWPISPWAAPADLSAERATSVPEPSTFALLAFSFLALRRRPRA